MIFGIVALLVAAAVVSAQDLRSYSSRSSRTDTSTSSSDESSDAKRIAKAIELALKEAELSSTLTTSSTSGDVALYRARLQTVNRARTCSFVCGAADGSGTGVIPLPAGEQDFFDGVKVTVTALNGVTKTAVFIEDTAENQDDLTGAFDLSAVALGNGNVVFTLQTLQSAFGLNITSITLEVADKAADVNGEPRTQLYFDPLNNPFWDFNTQLALSDVNARVTVDGVTIGCDADFEEIDFVGRTKFTVSAVGTADDDARTLTLNTTAGAFVFNANVFRVRHELSVLNELPYTSLPCSNRTAVTYDEIVVASTGSVESDVDSLLDHPLLYDELKSEANALTPAFDAFVRELQQAAGRRQIDLFDVILDRSAFTINSHDSKFTPCFRALAPEVEKFEVFVGMRSTSGPDGIIHAVLNVDNGDFQTQSTDTELTNSPSSSDTRSTTEFNTDLSNADDDDVEFLVREVVFSALGLNETLFAETIQGTVDRPYLLLPSDVTVTLEACPQFTYFN